MKPTIKVLLAAGVVTLGAAAIIGTGIASERAQGAMKWGRHEGRHDAWHHDAWRHGASG